MKKNIMLISQSLVGGGAEKVVANLSKVLANDANVFLVTYSKSDAEYEFAGTRIDIKCKGGNVCLFRKITNVVYRIFYLSYLKKKFHIDYAISFVPQTDYANVFSFWKKTKNIIEVSSNTSMAFTSKVSRFFRKIVLNRASHIVCVSEGSRKDLIALFKLNAKKVSTIYNPCDVERIRSLANEKIPEFTFNLKKYIVAVGSFRKPKGHWHLIKAFSLLSDKFPDLQLVILGDGVYREKYCELISNLNIDPKKVIMPGFVLNPYPIIRNAKLFVFPSIYEGFGNVIIESMACDVPVLCTDCNYGPREILYDNDTMPAEVNQITMADYGVIVPHCGYGDIDVSSVISGQEQILFEAIKKMLSDENILKMYSKKGVVRCTEFDSRFFEEKWLSLLNGL